MSPAGKAKATFPMQTIQARRSAATLRFCKSRAAAIGWTKQPGRTEEGAGLCDVGLVAEGESEVEELVDVEDGEAEGGGGDADPDEAVQAQALPRLAQERQVLGQHPALALAKSSGRRRRGRGRGKRRDLMGTWARVRRRLATVRLAMAAWAAFSSRWQPKRRARARTAPLSGLASTDAPNSPQSSTASIPPQVPRVSSFEPFLESELPKKFILDII